MLVLMSVMAAYVIALAVDALIVYAEGLQPEPVTPSEEVVYTPKEVRIKVHIDWTEDRIKEEVYKAAAKYNTYPEKMWATILCENAELDPKLQSRHILDYGREQSFGLAQFHIPSGNKTADGEVITKEMAQDPEIALDAMAYHFSVGNAELWTCFRMIYR